MPSLDISRDISSSIAEKKSWLLHQISYSSSLTLHSCPRKLQLEKLRAEESSTDGGGSIHFAFGHAVGAGIQAAFLPDSSIDGCYFAAFLAWDFSLLETAEKQKKSFWYALRAIDAAWHLAQSLRDEGWELAAFPVIENGIHLHDENDDPIYKRALEFSFRVAFPNDYNYRAFVDVVLVHRTTGKYKIVEVKTTGATWLHEAMYANSAQALSYAVVLDYLVKEYSSYEVLYLIYKTKSMEWEFIPFVKTRNVKAEWIRNVLRDCTTLDELQAEGYFPKHGESCFDFYKPCDYFGTCGYSDEFLGISDEDRLDSAISSELDKRYDVDLRLEDILENQLLTLGE